LQLRQLALKEVASQVERKVEREIPKDIPQHQAGSWHVSARMKKQPERLFGKQPALLIFTTVNGMYCMYKPPKENPDKIALDKQRHLINNFKLATEMGAEIIKISSNKVARTIIGQAVNVKFLRFASAGLVSTC
jgi:two-component system sensor histidine kinase KdpD